MPHVGPIEVSIVDFANPVIYVRAAEVGLAGPEDPPFYRAHPEVAERLERIRAVGAVMCGMAGSVEAAAGESPTFPNISVVAPPRAYRAFTDERPVAAAEHDLLARISAMRMLHQSYAGTGMANLGAASTVPGTLVHELAATTPGTRRTLRIGHPCGVSEVTVDLADDGTITHVGYERTARLLMEGTAHVDVASTEPHGAGGR